MRLYGHLKNLKQRLGKTVLTLGEKLYDISPTPGFVASSLNTCPTCGCSKRLAEMYLEVKKDLLTKLNEKFSWETVKSVEDRGPIRQGEIGYTSTDLSNDITRTLVGVTTQVPNLVWSVPPLHTQGVSGTGPLIEYKKL